MCELASILATVYRLVPSFRNCISGSFRKIGGGGAKVGEFTTRAITAFQGGQTSFKGAPLKETPACNNHVLFLTCSLYHFQILMSTHRQPQGMRPLGRTSRPSSPRWRERYPDWSTSLKTCRPSRQRLCPAWGCTRGASHVRWSHVPYKISPTTRSSSHVSHSTRQSRRRYVEFGATLARPRPETH